MHVNSNLDKAGDSDEKIVHGTVNIQSVVPNDSLCSQAYDYTPLKKKFKRKLRRRPVKKLCLTARLFDASLHIRKKKYKHFKRRNLQAPSLIREHRPDDSWLLSELVSSAAKDMTTSKVLINSIKMEHSLCLKDSVVIRKSSVGVINEGTQDKDTQISSKLTSDKKLQESNYITSRANELDRKTLDYFGDCKLGETHAGMKDILARGLAETTVECWDGVELPRSSNVDAEGTNHFSIGYVADEWDEEYDRGKRKKLRNSKHKLGGSNPFQEIACKKAKFRLGKIDWTNSRNNPSFRI